MISYCDCCNAPMVAVSHYGPDCSAGCDTNACLLCAGMVPPTAEELLFEIEDLTPHAADALVLARIDVLAKRAAGGVSAPLDDAAAEVLRAWTAAIQCEGIPGAYSEALIRLRAARAAKTTWFDSEQNRLRSSVDAYLDANDWQREVSDTGSAA